MKYSLDEVFGVSNKMVETYITRENIDSRFLKSLESERHIIIHGASKQGKTYLYKRHLISNEYIIVECSPTTTTIDIYKSILRQIGVSSNVSTSISSEITSNIETGVNIKIKVPLVGEIGSKLGVSSDDKIKETKTYSTFEYNLSLAQDVSEALSCLEFKKKIIIENLHYLNDEIQRKFAFDLRTFHSYNIQFIILGIWKEKNRLLQFNGDLVDRINEIPVEPWSSTDFHRIITKGEKLLNVNFNSVRDAIISDTFNSVGVLQELCKEACNFSEINRTSRLPISINETSYLSSIDLKVEHYSSRHFRSFESFVSQNSGIKNGNKPLFIPYYFLKTLSTMDIQTIQGGIKRKIIHNNIKECHHKPESIRSSDMSHFLHNIVKYQIRKGINPPLFDYDISNRLLRIIDSTLFFYLRYFKEKNIFDDLTNPLEE